MPVDFLTDAERERWQSLPDTVPQDDLYVFFLLTDDDKREAQRQREPHNRLGYALQLCILRYLGFVPDDLQETPHEVVTLLLQLAWSAIGGIKSLNQDNLFIIK
jgi:hypothetical protein